MDSFGQFLAAKPPVGHPKMVAIVRESSQIVTGRIHSDFHIPLLLGEREYPNIWYLFSRDYWLYILIYHWV